jgi:hypothetical protein
VPPHCRCGGVKTGAELMIPVSLILLTRAVLIMLLPLTKIPFNLSSFSLKHRKLGDVAPDFGVLES